MKKADWISRFKQLHITKMSDEHLAVLKQSIQVYVSMNRAKILEHKAWLRKNLSKFSVEKHLRWDICAFAGDTDPVIDEILHGGVYRHANDKYMDSVVKSIIDEVLYKNANATQMSAMET